MMNHAIIVLTKHIIGTLVKPCPGFVPGQVSVFTFAKQLLLQGWNLTHFTSFATILTAIAYKTPTLTECQDEGLKTADCSTVASTGSVSQWRQARGLKQDTKRSSQPLTIQLLVRFHKRRRVGLRYSIDDPFPTERQPKAAVNIIREALYVKAHLKINPNEYAIVTAEKLGIHRRRIPKLMTVIDRLPADFQQKLYECPDNRVHRIFNLKRLYKIASFETKDNMRKAIQTLKPDLI